MPGYWGLFAVHRRRSWQGLVLAGAARDTDGPGLLSHLEGERATPVMHRPTTKTTTTLSTPGYAALPHLVYMQHVATVTPTATVQAPLPYVSLPVATPPPGFSAPAAALDFQCPKSSPLDLPPVQRMLPVPAPPPVSDFFAAPALVPVPAVVVPACGVAAPTPGAVGPCCFGKTAPAPS
ncbi:uncharacterized protein LOC135214226 [Macrobrachium nipponense]|uniref:uncharacterized protein LOC135214226 n=1 Tax=Macrobrachium nipponense TaxID=159736 RepID=UPI0030C88B9F